MPWIKGMNRDPCHSVTGSLWIAASPHFEFLEAIEGVDAMRAEMMVRTWVIGAALLAAGVLVPGRALAHCDGMDGPVVKAAQQALANDNVNIVLIWIPPDQEGSIRSAFDKKRTVRKLNAAAKELADQYFFETLVRIHRAGEGAPYTGLKPAGRDLGPVIPAADRAIAEDVVGPLLKLLPEATHEAVGQYFRQVLGKKNFPVDNVAAGRQYVAAYVTFMHAVEGLHSGAPCGADEHGPKCPVDADQHGALAHSDQHAAAGHDQSVADEDRKQHPGAPAQHHDATSHTAEATVPRPLRLEHEELHTVLVQATQEGGKTAAAAQAVAHLLHPHFVKEEEYALPPLGLLPALAQGKITPEMKNAVALTDKLTAELPEMLEEHRGIVAALAKLAAAAQEEGKPQYARFAERLKLHAQTEEEVLYPAATLVGEYLKLKTSH
jgi:Family of unknown function (DUF6448)/Hemerythrin HHE cation binding domain